LTSAVVCAPVSKEMKQSYSFSAGV
jgi:hypothetical protein